MTRSHRLDIKPLLYQACLEGLRYDGNRIYRGEGAQQPEGWMAEGEAERKTALIFFPHACRERKPAV